MSGEELKFSSRYQLDRKLGSGGMGAVYRAYDSVLKKNVAVKLLLPSLNQNMAVRFQQEAKTAAKLDHPNIIRVLDFGQTDKGECYLIMEYLKGQTLEDMVKSNGPLEVDSALPIFEQICMGMQHAHSHGVLHRDVKPSNIMVNPESMHATIVDFGVAKFLSEDMSVTGKGKPLGSPAYMSPEQAQGQGVDIRSDIYSMGCLMYMTLVGEPPLYGSTSLETIKKQIEEPAPLLNDQPREGKFSDQLEIIVEKALEKNPDDRFSDFEELKQELSVTKKATFIPTDETQQPVPSLHKARHVVRWQKPLVATIGSMIVLVMLFVFLDAPGLLSPKKTQPKQSAPQFKFKRYPGYLIYRPHWVLATGNLHKNGIKELVDFRHSERLILDDPKINDDDLKSLMAIPLIALDVSNTRITANGLSLNSMPTLRCLILNDNKQIDDNSISQNIQVFRELQVLSLRGTNVTDKGVEELSKIPSLRGLDLEQLEGVTPKSIEYLSKMKHLRGLKISGTAIGAKDIEKLLKFPSLRYISFASNDVTDATFDTLLKLQPLLINVSNSQITDNSLQKLSKIKYPVIIEVNGCKKITKNEVMLLRDQFPPDQRIIDRIQSDFFDPSSSCGLPEGEGNLHCLRNSLWYEPKNYQILLEPGYPEVIDHMSKFTNILKNKRKSKERLQLSPFIDMDTLEKEIDDGFERHKDDILLKR